MTIARHCVIGLMLVVVAGCSGAPKTPPRMAAPAPSAERMTTLQRDLNALTQDFIKSLTAAQVREANLHHRLHPEFGGTHGKPGEGLSWDELNSSQQEMLRSMWEAKLAGSRRGVPRAPGPMERAEVFGVGYAVLQRSHGPTTTLHLLCQRFPLSTTFRVDLPGLPPLAPPVQQEGIDLAATGVISATRTVD